MTRAVTGFEFDPNIPSLSLGHDKNSIVRGEPVSYRPAKSVDIVHQYPYHTSISWK